MGREYTKLNADAAEHLGFGAGLLATGFTPATGAVTGIFGATSGGITFNPNPEYTDFAEDIDQAPNNMKEFKQLTSWDPVLSGNLVELKDITTVKNLVGPADVTTGTHLVSPRAVLESEDFLDEIWWIGDYTNNNVNGTGTGAAKAGFIAICLKNALNTTGFQVSATKGEKQQYAFEFHGHYTITNQDAVPYEIYIFEGQAAS